MRRPISRVMLTVAVVLPLSASAAVCNSLSSGVWSVAARWSCAAVPGAGDAVTISNGHRVAVDMAATAASLNLAVGNSATTLTIGVGQSLTVAGNVIVNTDTANRTRRLDVGGGALTVGGNLTLASTGNNRLAILDIGAGTVRVAGDLTANRATEQVVFSGAGRLRIGGDFTRGGTLTRGNGTVEFDGAGSQRVGDYFYHHLTFAKAAGTATLDGNVTVSGNLRHDGGLDGLSGSRTVTLAGGAGQSVGGAAVLTLYRLDVSNAAGVVLAGDVTVSNRLRLQAGHVSTGGFVLQIGTGNTNATQGSVTGAAANRHVIGALSRWIRTRGGTASYAFPVGQAGYAPLTLSLDRVTTGGYLTVATFVPDHPQIASSGLDPTKTVNRWWRVANAGVVFNAASARNRMDFVWPAADRDAGSNFRAYAVMRFAGAAWGATRVPGNRSATGLRLDRYATTGEFAVGEAGAGAIGGFDGLESGAAFVPLNVAGARNPIRTKVAAAGQTIDVVAVRGDKSGIETSFVGSVKVEFLDASNNAGAFDANGCKAGWVSGPTQPPVVLSYTGDTGRRTLTLSETDVWREIRLRLSYPAVGAASVIACSTDAFAVRPATLTLAASDTDWVSAGTLRTLNTLAAPGGTVHKAGRPFTLTVTGRNGAGNVTSRYDGAPQVTVSGYLLPAACSGTCTLTPGALAPVGGGAVASTTATYSEVGVLSLQASDATFAAVDAGDGSTAAQMTAQSAATGVGRFVPDRLLLLPGASVTAACAPAGQSYMGQAFSVNATLAAQNAAGATTVHYDAARIGAGAVATVSWQAEDSDNGTDLSARLAVAPAAPAAAYVWSSGLLAVANAGNATFRRATPDAPDGPYNSLQVGVRAVDPDGVLLTGLTVNPAAVGCGGGCTGAAVGGPTAVRFGRVRLSAAAGSNTRRLPMPLALQFWTGVAFAANAADTCSAFTAAQVTLSAPMTRQGVCPAAPAVTVGGTCPAGNLCLAPVGGANLCAYDVTLAVPAWLRGFWNSSDNDGNAQTNYDDDPIARATFGVFRDNVLYRRENY